MICTNTKIKCMENHKGRCLSQGNCMHQRDENEKMSFERARELMKIEKECINRACDRNCSKCDLVQNVYDLNRAYDIVISVLHEEIEMQKIVQQMGGLER